MTRISGDPAPCPGCAPADDAAIRDGRIHEAMVHAVLCELWAVTAGLPAPDAAFLPGLGFSASDIMRHEDAARAEARRRFAPARVELC